MQRHGAGQFRIVDRSLPVPTRLAGLGDQFLDGADRNLHLLVTEYNGTEHHFLGQTLGFGFHHEHRVLGARDHQVQIRLRELLGRRIQHVLAVFPAYTCRGDRTAEGQARQRQRGGGADQCRNVGIDLGIDRQHDRDDLYVVDEPIGKQRADRPVDQTRSQRLFLGGPALTLEETARNATGGVGLLDVVDGQGEEIPSGDGFLRGTGGDEHHCVAHGHAHRACGLAGQLARLNRDGMRAVRK